MAHTSQHRSTSSGVLFSNDNANFLPIVASFGNFIANLRTVSRNFLQAQKKRWSQKIDKYQVLLEVTFSKSGCYPVFSVTGHLVC